MMCSNACKNLRDKISAQTAALTIITTTALLKLPVWNHNTTRTNAKDKSFNREPLEFSLSVSTHFVLETEICQDTSVKTWDNKPIYLS